MIYPIFYTIQISVLIALSHQAPHVFREVNTCKLSVQAGKEQQFYNVPVGIHVENDQFVVYVSLCNKNEYVINREDTLSAISVYNKASQLYLNDTNVPKPYRSIKVKEEILITLRNEIECKKDKNYFISIKMGKYKVPGLKMDTECEMEIEIPWSIDDPPCKKHVEDKWFIDLTPFRNNPITVQNGLNETYMISLCGPVEECEGLAGCKIGKDGTIATRIGSLEKLKIDKVGSSEITVYSSVKKPDKTMTVTLKCRWDVPFFSEPKLLNEGKNHKFEVYSSFGCVKKPTCCVIKDDHNLMYNLTDLGTKYGSVVKNTSRSIKLNVCGDLNINKQITNLESPQVIEVIGTKYINRGRLPKIEFVENNGIKAFITEGDMCNENEAYSTTVDFECSHTDTGPIFTSEEGCVTNLKWKTPKACPKFQIVQNGCELNASPYGRLNLTELYRTEGFTTWTSSKQKVVYNICGKLNRKCATSDDVSVCLIEENSEKILGWNNPTVSFINGEIQLKYTGEECENRRRPYVFTMNLSCSFEEENSNYTVSEIDSCTYETNIATKTACLKPWEMKECVFDTDKGRFDLSYLIAKERSYEIEDDKNRDVTFFLNVCAPLIPVKGTLFYPGSMVYMSNSSIRSITKRYTNIGSIAGPTWKDGELIVEANAGDECKPGVPFSSKIIFECSDEEKHPYLLENLGCHFNFLWKSKHACQGSKKERETSKNNMKTHQKKTDDRFKYRSDNVDDTNVNNAEHHVIKVQTEKVETENNHQKQTTQIIPKIQTINKSELTEKEIEPTVGKSINNTTESKIDSREKQSVSNGGTNTREVEEKDEVEDLPIAAEDLKENRSICEIVDVQGRNIDWYKLESFEFKEGGDNYIFNFDGTSSRCKGLICKNGDDILSFIENCPEVLHRDGFTVLKYSTGRRCDVNDAASSVDGVVEISLGCNKNTIVASATEQECKISIVYNSPKICISSTSSSSLTLIIVLVLLFLLVISSLFVYILYKRNYFKKCSYDSVSENEGLVVHSKML